MRINNLLLIVFGLYNVLYRCRRRIQLFVSDSDVLKVAIFFFFFFHSVKRANKTIRPNKRTASNVTKKGTGPTL